MPEDKKERSFFEDLHEDKKTNTAAKEIFSSFSSGAELINAAHLYDNPAAEGATVTLAGISGALSGTYAASQLGLMSAAGPLGIGFGALAAYSALQSSKRKREQIKKERRRLKNKWLNALKQYRAGLTKAGKRTEAAQKATKMAEAEIFSLTRQIEQDAASFETLAGKRTKGVKDITSLEKSKALKETAHAQILAEEDRLLEKFDILTDINKLIKEEREAERDVFSSIRTLTADRLEARLQDLEEIE